MGLHVTPDYINDEAEAVHLMLHHLRLAAIYFENSPENIGLPADEFSLPAMAAWLHAMEELYPDD